MQTDELFISPVFKALSKPQKILGVDYDYFFVCALLVMMLFIYSSNILAFILVLPLHWVGWVLLQIDADIFKLLSVRSTIGLTKNRKLWGCQSYEAC